MMPVGWSVAPTLRGVYLAHACIVTLVGASMNIFVIHRMRRLYRRNPEQASCMFIDR